MVSLTKCQKNSIIYSMIDTHTHCNHSGDSQADPREMLLTAIGKGMEYYAFTDHCNRDFELADVFCMPPLDLDKHFVELEALRDEFADKIDVGVGMECGWSDEAQEDYVAIEKKYPCDVIINSVHMVEKEDIYQQPYFLAREKNKAYGDYLTAVRASLDATYHYDIVGHVGYITRKAPYADKSLRHAEFSEMFDDILRAIIAKGKALEINTHTCSSVNNFIPSKEIFARYKQLGGELVTFGSDAHRKENIGANYDFASEMLISLGYKYLFKYKAHKPIAVKI